MSEKKKKKKKKETKKKQKNKQQQQQKTNKQKQQQKTTTTKQQKNRQTKNVGRGESSQKNDPVRGSAGLNELHPLPLPHQPPPHPLSSVFSFQIFNAARQLSHIEAAPDKYGLVLLDYWVGLNGT